SSIRSAPAGSSRTCSPRVRAPPRPRSSRTTWIHGQYGGATASSPQYAQHTVNPCARAVELSSRARRVLPIPAGPVRSRTGPGGCGASRSAATRAPSCRSRPTKRRISTSAGGSASGSRPPEPWWGDDMVRATVVGGPDRPEPAPVDPVRGDAGAQGGGAGLVSGRGWSVVVAGDLAVGVDEDHRVVVALHRLHGDAVDRDAHAVDAAPVEDQAERAAVHLDPVGAGPGLHRPRQPLVVDAEDASVLALRQVERAVLGDPDRGVLVVVLRCVVAGPGVVHRRGVVGGGGGAA